MATQNEKLVRVQSEDGTKQYAMTERQYKSQKMAAFDGKTYEDMGYTIVSYEDGTPYEKGATPTDWAIDKNAATSGIGENPTAVTDVDGEKMTVNEVAALGVDVTPNDANEKAAE
jgi:hypothetical protein